MKNNFPNGDEPWMIVLRLIFGACGVFISLKYLAQIPSGAVEWTSGESGLPELTYTYRASSVWALVAATVGFGGFAFGFLVFAVYPKVGFRAEWVVPWIIISMAGLGAMKRLSQCTGIISSG